MDDLQSKQLSDAIKAAEYCLKRERITGASLDTVSGVVLIHWMYAGIEQRNTVLFLQRLTPLGTPTL